MIPFRLDFSTPRCINRKELRIDKLNLSLGIRALRYDARLRNRNDEQYVKKCWLEKDSMVNKDLYSMEKEKFYNNKGWGLTAIEEMKNNEVNIEQMTKQKIRDIQKQLDEVEMRNARYIMRNIKILI